MSKTPFKIWLEDQSSTLQELADELETSKTHLSQIASGVRFPGRELALKLHQRTGIALAELLSPPAAAE